MLGTQACSGAAGRQSSGALAEPDAELDAEATEDVENLLESYFIQIDRAFSRLTSLGAPLHYGGLWLQFLTLHRNLAGRQALLHSGQCEYRLWVMQYRRVVIARSAAAADPADCCGRHHQAPLAPQRST